MKTAFYSCPLGILRMRYQDECLLELQLCDEQHPGEENERASFTDKVFLQISEYINGERQTFEIQYKMTGTSFQQKVWRALAEIPYGVTRSYEDIAIQIDNPKAMRAVGGACNKNPIWLIVPCHRVIGKKGALIGYAGGVDVKETLLKIEKENTVHQ